MIDASELPTTPADFLIDPEAPIDPALSLPEIEDPNPRPAPEVTSLDPWPDDVERPRALLALQKKAEVLGWQARPGYSRGFIWGPVRDIAAGTAKSQWKRREEVCVWLFKAGRPRLAFSWERDPHTTAKGGPSWKADQVLQFSGNMYRAYGHIEGRKLL